MADFKVHDKEYNYPGELNFGEMVDAERYFGVEFDSDKNQGMRMAAAMIYIAIRREDSTVTVDDIRALSPEVFEAVIAGDAIPPVSSGASTGSAGSSGGSSTNGSDGQASDPLSTTAASSPASATSSPPRSPS